MFSSISASVTSELLIVVSNIVSSLVCDVFPTIDDVVVSPVVKLDMGQSILVFSRLLLCIFLLPDTHVENFPGVLTTRPDFVSIEMAKLKNVSNFYIQIVT